jgi:pimeloyl-ACP methyl ester carboxylesterase
VLRPDRKGSPQGSSRSQALPKDPGLTDRTRNELTAPWSQPNRTDGATSAGTSLEAWALVWQPLMAAGHQLIAYDLRGHGRSTLGRSGSGVQAYAQDLAAVLDHFDVRQGVVVAHSTGGIGALALAVDAPAGTRVRLAGQVLISTPPQGIGDSLQNRLLAPLVFSGLIHQVVRRRRLAPCSPAPCSAPTLTRTWSSSPAASWHRRHDRQPSTHPRRCCGSTSGAGSAR